MSNTETASFLRPGERADDLQRGGYRIIQGENSFRFGIDAVLLAAFAQAHPRERVLDLGTGTGVIPTLMLARSDCRHFTGLEIDPESAERAGRSVKMNGLEESIHILEGDMREIKNLFSPASFDVVTCNPPYMTAGHGILRGQRRGAAVPAAHQEDTVDSITAARHEILCTLQDVTAAAAYVLPEQGRFYMVHRPFRLAEIIRTLSQYRLEPKRIRFVCPTAAKEPNLVLIEARKGARSGVVVEPMLAVYEKPGQYTEEVLRIYREE